MNTQFGRAGCSTARPGGAAVPGDFRGDAGQLGQGGNAIVEPRDDDDLMDYTEHSRDAPAQDNIGHPPLGPVARSLAGEGDRIETPVCPDELSTVSVPSGQPNLDEVFPVLPILAKVGHPSPAASAEGSSPHQFQGWYFSCACTQACSAQPSLETSRGSSKYWTVLSTEAPQSDTETDAASPILDDPGYQLCISPDDFQQQPARPFGESDEQDRAMFCGPAPPQEQQEQPNRNNDDCSGAGGGVGVGSLDVEVRVGRKRRAILGLAGDCGYCGDLPILRPRHAKRIRKNPQKKSIEKLG